MPQQQKINALKAAPKKVQQMSQKAPGPLGPGTWDPARPLGPGPWDPGLAIFGSSAGPFWRCLQGIADLIAYACFINFPMCLCNIFVASGGGFECNLGRILSFWGGIWEVFGGIWGVG